jgi:hypothetical protein
MRKNIFSALVSVVLCVVLVVTAMVFHTSAADGVSVSLGSANAKAGDTVTVSVNLNSNPGIISLGLDVSYDTSKLKLTGVTDKGVLNGWSGAGDYSGSSYRLFWSDDLVKTNNSATGTVATLTFQVLDGFSDSTSVSVSPVSGSTYDYDLNDVSVSASGGKINASTAPTSSTTTTTKKATSTTKKSTTTTTKRYSTTTSSYDDIDLTETESYTDYFDFTDFTFETEPETEESTTEPEQEEKKMSKTKAVLIVLMVCFAIVGVAIIISIVKKSKD